MLDRFFRFLKRGKKDLLICGGIGEIVVVDQYRRRLGSLFYNRPEYNQKAAFELEFQAYKLDETSLKKINQSPSAVIAAHNEIANNLYIPYAKKIFVTSKGFRYDKTKSLDDQSLENQFALLCKYHKNCLIELVEIAFRINTKSKKKN